MTTTRVCCDPRIFSQILTVYLATFEDFLRSFKTTPQTGLVGALGDMNIDEDDFSDEYDFMDDDEDEESETVRRAARTKAKEPKLKYYELLQKIADRLEDEITIDLDDLASVRKLL